MLVGLLFGYVNNKILKKRILKEMESIFFHKNEYPENKEFDPKSMVYDKNIKKLLFQKCNLLNIIYEISRLQLAI